MRSWVRYSVAVYVGLLLAGALVGPRPELSDASGPAPTWSPEKYRWIEQEPGIWLAEPLEPADDDTEGHNAVR